MIRPRGFTIVELLIVIVVIGILAAITMVAFSTITTRANNTQTTAGFKEFIKAFYAYGTENGDYPNAAGCLGEGYPSNRCLSQDNTGACFGLGGATNTALNAALRPYMGGKLPTVSMQQASCGGTSYIGAYAAYNSTSKIMNAYMILRGDQTCPAMSPNVTSYSKLFTDDATRCHYVLAAFAS